MLRDITKRLKRLEGSEFTPLEIQAAAKNYHATGELPTDPRLAEITLYLAACLKALNDSMPDGPGE